MKVVTVCNLDDVTMIEILPDESKESLSRIAKMMPTKSIKEIWLDANDLLYSNVRETFPNAQIRVGKDEIERLLNRQLKECAKEIAGERSAASVAKLLCRDGEELSKRATRRVEEILSKNPDIAKIYDAREALKKNGLTPEWIDRTADELINTPVSSIIAFILWRL